MGQIAGLLNESGILTGNGCLWSHKTVSAVLRNAEYAGDVVCGKTKIVRGKAVKQPPEKWICLPGRHEAIISRDEFRLVQERLSSRPACRVRKEMRLKNPLAGVLFCGICGAPMTRKQSGSGERLRCGGACRQNMSSSLNAVEMRFLQAAVSCLFPRMRTISLPVSGPAGERKRLTGSSALFRLIRSGDPALRNAFYRCIAEKCSYFRSRYTGGDFQLEIKMRL